MKITAFFKKYFLSDSFSSIPLSIYEMKSYSFGYEGFKLLIFYGTCRRRRKKAGNRKEEYGLEELKLNKNPGSGVILPEFGRSAAVFSLKYPVKVRKIIKSALKGNFSYGLGCID